MEIETTSLLADDPSDYSASIAERGQHAAKQTWAAALERAARPLLSTPAELAALRRWAEETGAWDEAEIAAWSDAECNALFIQLVSGDMRDADLFDAETFDWADYEARAQAGQVSGNLYRADDGRVYYSLD